MTFENILFFVGVQICNQLEIAVLALDPWARPAPDQVILVKCFNYTLVGAVLWGWVLNLIIDSSVGGPLASEGAAISHQLSSDVAPFWTLALWLLAQNDLLGVELLFALLCELNQFVVLLIFVDFLSFKSIVKLICRQIYFWHIRVKVRQLQIGFMSLIHDLGSWPEWLLGSMRWSMFRFRSWCWMPACIFNCQMSVLLLHTVWWFWWLLLLIWPSPRPTWLMRIFKQGINGI